MLGWGIEPRAAVNVRFTAWWALRRGKNVFSWVIKGCCIKHAQHSKTIEKHCRGTSPSSCDVMSYELASHMKKKILV